MDYSQLGQSIAKLKHSYTKNGFPNLPIIINKNRMNYIKILKMLPRIKKYSSIIYKSVIADINSNILPKRYIYLLDAHIRSLAESELQLERRQNEINDLNDVLKTIINRNITVIFKFYTILCKKDKTFAGFSTEHEMLEFFLSVLNENTEYIYEEYVKLIALKENAADIALFKKTITEDTQ